uniref:UDP-glucuronosyltransferase n=1 Tax=Steinernema glaseri TaxID=37863 RepID=A0A1I8AHA5_9BILA
MLLLKVVFAYNGPNVTVGAHVKLVPWVPQVDILNHASTRLFVTHGGVKSLREALCSSTPLLVLPLAAEQTLNGAIAMELRVGHVLNKFTLSSKKLLASMRELLGSASYARNVARLHDLFLDRPISALDEAAFFARRAIRLGNRPATLKIRGAQLDWATALHLPFAALLVVLCFILSC